MSTASRTLLLQRGEDAYSLLLQRGYPKGQGRGTDSGHTVWPWLWERRLIGPSGSWIGTIRSSRVHLVGGSVLYHTLRVQSEIHLGRGMTAAHAWRPHHAWHQ